MTAHRAGDHPIVVLVTTSDRAEAERVAARLIERRLVACVNMVEGVSSHFIWKGRLEQATECLLIAKSVRRVFGSLTREVRAAHSYEVPEIIALPIVEGDAAYLAWIAEIVAAESDAQAGERT